MDDRLWSSEFGRPPGSAGRTYAPGWRSHIKEKPCQMGAQLRLDRMRISRPHVIVDEFLEQRWGSHFVEIPAHSSSRTVSSFPESSAYLGAIALLHRRKTEPRVHNQDSTTYLKMGDWLRKMPALYTNVMAYLAATATFGSQITLLHPNDPISGWFGEDGPLVAQLIHGSLICMITRHPTHSCGLCALPLKNEKAAPAELDPCVKQLGFSAGRRHVNLADEWCDEPPYHWLTPRLRRGENSPRQLFRL